MKSETTIDTSQEIIKRIIIEGMGWMLQRLTEAQIGICLDLRSYDGEKYSGCAAYTPNAEKFGQVLTAQINQGLESLKFFDNKVNVETYRRNDSMAKLTTAKRKKLKSSVFGLPAERAYPMNDKSHAANAKARASQQVKKGNLSSSEKSKIDAKANKILYGSSKPKTKKRGKR